MIDITNKLTFKKESDNFDKVYHNNKWICLRDRCSGAYLIGDNNNNRYSQAVVSDEIRLYSINGKKYKLGMVASCFDLFHAGHLLFLKEAKSLCDYVVAGLQTNPTIERPYKNKPTQSLEERRIQLEGCKYIDEIVEYTTEAELADIIKKYKFDVRVKGSDHKGIEGVTDHLFNNIHYHDRSGYPYSSGELRSRIYNAEIERIENGK